MLINRQNQRHSVTQMKTSTLIRDNIDNDICMKGR